MMVDDEKRLKSSEKKMRTGVKRKKVKESVKWK